ncbi:hypothetical protein AAFF_G00065760, partial [Aldrovandia affinis]
ILRNIFTAKSRLLSKPQQRRPVITLNVAQNRPLGDCQQVTTLPWMDQFPPCDVVKTHNSQKATTGPATTLGPEVTKALNRLLPDGTRQAVDCDSDTHREAVCAYDELMPASLPLGADSQSPPLNKTPGQGQGSNPGCTGQLLLVVSPGCPRANGFPI